MNTPAQNEDDLRCAEYALGVLDLQERRALETDVTRNPGLQRTLDDWHERLAPLAQDIAPVTPPARIWTRIQRDLGFLPEGSVAKKSGWWNSLDLWRWLAVGASAVALVLVAVNLTRAPQAPQQPTVAQAPQYMVATIAQKDGVAHWTATVDVSRSRMVVVPAVQSVIAADRATELWLIPPDAKPIALGVFPSNTPATMNLPPEIMALLSNKAVLAVSVEPPGGSPTGAPTGPVIGTGEIRGT
ncbi:anti-sigma factor [Caballeronia sp. GACF4]|uniref:anti-sigma factor n=1 Tax=Caballeronia sp. GACF4 TaxID=2921763 RepID=UPI0020286AF0|nr:anti-sigma factor [Caballeronia sp. GACF4]